MREHVSTVEPGVGQRTQRNDGGFVGTTKPVHGEMMVVIKVTTNSVLGETTVVLRGPPTPYTVKHWWF